MAEKTKKGDFIEIEYVGRANGEVFDTNIPSEAKKLKLESVPKPLTICIGEEMVVKGFDRELADKELGKKYTVSLSPENSFGKRMPSMIKIIPLSAFFKQNMNPVPGLMLNLDGMVAKVLSVSGGRVSVDFNNPLAGKNIDYEFTVLRIVALEDEKINSLQDFFFKKRFKFTSEEKRITFEAEAGPFVKFLGKKLGTMLGKEIDVEKKEEQKKESAPIAKTP